MYDEQRVGAGELATVKGYRMTADDRFRAALIERVMCDFEVDVAAIAACALGVDIPETWTSRVPTGVFWDVTGGEHKTPVIPVSPHPSAAGSFSAPEAAQP